MAAITGIRKQQAPPYSAACRQTTSGFCHEHATKAPSTINCKHSVAPLQKHAVRQQQAS